MEYDIVRGKSILLAEDEPGVRQALDMLLSLDHHRVTVAENGAVALDLFTQGKFDLVITDLRMPVMRGDELAVRIKQLAPQQPVLMLTAFAEEAQGAQNPVDLIVNKPIDLAHLRRAISNVLAARPETN